MKLEVALAVLMKFIEPEQDWHTKEEVLKLIIVCYLKTHNEGLIDFNQELILSKVSQLVDDESAKVRLGALETLTVICHSTRTTESLETLARLVDRDAYEVVIDGLEQGKVAYVGDHKVIDFTREKCKKSPPLIFFNNHKEKFSLEFFLFGKRPISSH